MTQPAKHRDLAYVVEQSASSYARAVRSGLMQVTLEGRRRKVVTLEDGRDVVEFVGCSYLGLDLHPAVIAAAQRIVADWGVHLCCARSRFSIGPNRALEEGLSELFGGRAITFPTVTSAHMSVLPLIASGVLLDRGARPPGPRRRVRLIFDRLAHASMQFLKPILATEAAIATVPHNDLAALGAEAESARAGGEAAVYVADGVYSMGAGVCPIEAVLGLARELDVALYIDDAHGTSIFGERGEGFVASRLEGGPVPANLFFNFSLAKGFGCNGGGIVVPDAACERLVRSFGQTYAFSAPLDFSIVGAALAALELHRDGTVRALQRKLRENVALFDEGRPDAPPPEEWSPIRMIPAGSAERALAFGERLLELGYFCTVSYFPIVPRESAQLRLAITADHTPEQIAGLKRALDDALARTPPYLTARS